jgi:hypothetical protein
MRIAFLCSAVLLVLAVVAQFYFAAAGVFSSAEHDRFAAHEFLGRIGIPVLGAVTVLTALLARAGKGLVWTAAVPLFGIVAEFLLFLVNVLLSGGPTDETPVSAMGSVVLGLHSVIGLVVFMAAVHVTAKAFELVRGGGVRGAGDVRGAGASRDSKVVA